MRAQKPLPRPKSPFFAHFGVFFEKKFMVVDFYPN